MRRFLFLATIAFISILTTSCKEDEELVPIAQNTSIIGQWDLTKSIDEIEQNGESSKITTDYPDENGYYTSYIFKDNNDAIYIQNNSLDVEKSIAYMIKYHVDGDTLVIGSGKETRYTIVLINETNLVLSNTYKNGEQTIQSTDIYIRKK